MAAVVQLLLVLALLVVHSQGEQTAVYTGHCYIATLQARVKASLDLWTTTHSQSGVGLLVHQVKF